MSFHFITIVPSVYYFPKIDLSLLYTVERLRVIHLIESNRAPWGLKRTNRFTLSRVGKHIFSHRYKFFYLWNQCNFLLGHRIITNSFSIQVVGILDLSRCQIFFVPSADPIFFFIFLMTFRSIFRYLTLYGN